MEVAFLLELLKSSRILRKDEYAGITESLLHAGEINRKQDLERIVRQYVKDYPEGTKEALLKIQWDLQQCIMEADIIQLFFQDQTRMIASPVGLMTYRQEMYLFAYDPSEKLQAVPVRRIDSFQIRKRKFDRKLFEVFKQLSWKELQKMLEELQKESEENQ